MDYIDISRKGIISVINKVSGTRFGSTPKGISAQHKDTNLTEMDRLPTIIVPPIQNMETGEFYYLAGYDPIGEAPLG